MKRKITICLMFITVVLYASIAAAQTRDDIETHRECAHCGMDRKAYGFSRMLVQYEDGTEVGICSLHCALIELDEHKGRKVKAILVADRNTKRLVEAEKAIWVLGGKKSGVMTKRAKWAFVSEEGADKFIESYGGKIVSWDETLSAAREDISNEVR